MNDAAHVVDDPLFELLVDSITDYSIYLLSPDGIIQSWNNGAKRIKGYDASEIVGSSFRRFFTPEDRDADEPGRILRDVEQTGRVETEGWRVRKDGTRFWANVIVSEVRRTSGELLGYAKITRDVTQQREIREALDRTARTDALTGLATRTQFFESFDDVIASTSTGRVAVVVIGLDRFKLVNDEHGHPIGDLLLRTRATDLMQALGHSQSLAARLGGDQFACAIPFDSAADLSEVLARVGAAFRNPLHVGPEIVASSASMGVAVYPDDATDVDHLLIDADLAMSRAKRELTIRPQFFTAELDDAARSRRFMAHELSSALVRGQLRLVFQNQVRLSDGVVVGREALLRWDHPRLGSVSPGTFIPLAEATNDIIDIGDWVLTEACTRAAEWTDGLRVAVNVSPAQVTRDAWVDELQRALAVSGLPPERLEIEVTESALLNQTPDTLRHLEQAQALGVSIALDDLGAGYSSLGTLLSFPFDKIKIDRALIARYPDDARAPSALRAMLTLGHTLPAQVLVEGVETLDQLRLVEQQGFDEAQGFHLHRPQ
ncbi:putative bifunctional diguanylate cyclase/phosphodiesterase [Cnuibacter sp. UC19_7]|uniref:putative bifunctional diguanylate cyclase/phosphodiesterase n=1 Tax=Cnuibacter sp. UC19_7 TaxID=3350166 RepID=UPI00366B4AAD